MDITRLLDHPTAIVGATGSGKTFTAKGAVEQLLAEGRRVIIIDPTGAWWGLRAGADGDEAGGFPVIIFGGDHADVEITPDGETGKALALALADRDVQAIIDTSEMTGGEKNRFLTPFLEHLYAKNRAALHIVVDEADEVAAQRLADGEQRLFGIFDKIVRRGRIKGFRPLMISQRPAVIHKNVLSQIGTLIAMKLPGPQDRKAIEDWVKGNADADQARAVMQSLPGLARGEGWVWSPADDVLDRVTFPAIRTFDSSRTPEIGEVVTAPALASVDVEALRTALAAKAEEPASAANNAPQVTPAEIKAAEQRGFELGLKQGREEGTDHGKTVGAAVALAAVRNALEALRIPDIVVDVASTSVPASSNGRTSAFDAVNRGSNPRAGSKTPTATKPEKPVDLSTDPLLNAALQVWPAKMTWGGLASMCGRKARGGYFNSVRKRLIDSGLLREESGLVIVASPPKTPAGAIPADLLEKNLPQPAAKMFAAIRQRPGITAIGLASVLQMQPRGGHWNNGMAILRRNDLIVEADGLRIADGLEGI